MSEIDDLFNEIMEIDFELDPNELKRKLDPIELKRKLEFINKVRPLFAELSMEERFNFFLSGITTTGNFCEKPRTFFLNVAKLFLEVSKQYKEEAENE